MIHLDNHETKKYIIHIYMFVTLLTYILMRQRNISYMHGCYIDHVIVEIVTIINISISHYFFPFFLEHPYPILKAFSVCKNKLENGGRQTKRKKKEERDSQACLNEYLPIKGEKQQVFVSSSLLLFIFIYFYIYMLKLIVYIKGILLIYTFSFFFC